MAEKQKPGPGPGGDGLVLAQDPHGVPRAGGHLLEQAIGREVRALREQLPDSEIVADIQQTIGPEFQAPGILELALATSKAPPLGDQGSVPGELSHQVVE